MGGRLLLLAKRFPYNHGEIAAESYLETEIGVLSDNFDHVLAVATEASVGDEPTCALPKNVEAVALGCTPTKTHKVALAGRGALYTVSAPDEVREALMTDPVDTVRQHVFRGYFVARAHEKYTRIMSELENRSFEPTAIYSFWLYDTALTALWMRGVYPCASGVGRAHGYDL